MPAVSGTVQTYDRKGLRESLSNFIYDITPMDTIFMTSAGRGSAEATLEEWQTDALAAADGTNAAVEGNDATFSAPSATVRVGNYTQISDKTLIISGTTEAVKKAGRKSELARELTKRGKELKRDMETIFLRAQAGAAGGASTARTLAALNAWVKTNVDKHSGGGNPTYTSGVPSAVRTDGTQRALTETIAKNVIQLGWTNGADLKAIMAGPVNKQKISAFSGVVTRNFDQSNVSPKPTAIIAAADVYVSDFGTLRVMPNRYQRERDAWFLDFDMVEIKYLRPFDTHKLAKTGDAEKRLLNVEYTLCVHNEAGLGLAADLTTT